MSLIKVKTDTIDQNKMSSLVLPNTDNDLIKSVATISDLPASGYDGQVIGVRGHTTEGDGGDGLFVYDATGATAHTPT